MPIYTTEGYRITQGVCKSDHFPSSNTHARSIHFMDFLYKIPSMRAFNSPLSCRINSECIHDRVSPQSAMFLRGSKLHGLTLCNLIWINVHFTLHIFLQVGAATHRHDRGLFICDSASGRSSLFYRLYGKRPCRRQQTPRKVWSPLFDVIQRDTTFQKSCLVLKDSELVTPSIDNL